MLKPELLEILACPMCKGPLTLESDSGSRDESLSCQACSEFYPIEDGIPNLLPPDLRDD